MTIRRPGRSGPTTCSGFTPPTSSPRWSRPKSGPSVHAERPRGRGVEAAGPVVLHERVAVGGPAVLDGERGDEVAVEVDLLVGLELLDAQRVTGAAEHEAHRLDQPAQAGRPVEDELALARAQVERLDHPDQAEPVVEVEVGDEDRVELGQPDRAQQLLLGPLAAVEEQPVAARAQRASRAGRGGPWARIRRCRRRTGTGPSSAGQPSRPTAPRMRGSRAVEPEERDVVVIGAGVAGLSARRAAGRARAPTWSCSRPATGSAGRAAHRGRRRTRTRARRPVDRALPGRRARR